MATTTNYGWTTPDDTALVKDGASAIRSLGSAIDSTLKTQIDAQIPDSIVDAKGDLISATADNTPARLASSGVNNDVLTVDTSTATGLKWAAPTATSGPTFAVRRATSAQTFNASTFTKIQFNDELWDTDNAFDSTTNYRFTPLKAGYYQINFSVRFTCSPTVQETNLYIYKNGSNYHATYKQENETATSNIRAASSLVYLNGSSDYIEFYIWSNAGTTRQINNDTVVLTSGVWIRS